MKDVAVVAYCRTGIARASRGALNQTHGIPMRAHVPRHAVSARGIYAAEVEDVVVGCGLPEGATGHNIARNAALEAGFGDAVFILLSDIAVVVRHPDGSFTSNHEPVSTAANLVGCCTSRTKSSPIWIVVVRPETDGVARPYFAGSSLILSPPFATGMTQIGVATSAELRSDI